MTKREKLTEHDRFVLRNPLNTRSVLTVGAKVVDLLDAETARADAAEARVRELGDSVRSWKDRAEQAENGCRALAATAADLRQQVDLARSEARVRELESAVRGWKDRGELKP